MSVCSKKAGSLIFAACFLATPAFAQQVEDENGLYVRASIGAAFGSDISQSLAFDPAAPFVGAQPSQQQTEIDSTLSFGGAVGFHYPGGTRTELEYRHLKAGVSSVSRTGGLDVEAIAPSGDFVVQLLMSNFYKDFDNSSAFTPYIGFGVGGAFVSNGLGERDSEFAYQGRAGIAVAVDQGLTFDVEYNYVRTTALEFGPDFDELSAPTNDARLAGGAYASSSILFSLRKEF